jgi:hypothetical protein
MTGWNRVHIGCVCLAATVAAVLTACGSANPPLASPTTTAQSPSVAVAHTTTAPAPLPTSTAAPTGTSPVGTTRAPSSTTAACHTGDFRAGAANFLSGEAGLVFRVPLINIGAVACQTEGWPGVSFLDGNGKDIGDAARVGPAPQRQTVSAGSTVQVTITVSNPAGGDGCVNFNENAQTSTQLLLTPPNERDSLTVGAPGRGVLLCHPRVFPIGSTSTTR